MAASGIVVAARAAPAGRNRDRGAAPARRRCRAAISFRRRMLASAASSSIEEPSTSRSKFSSRSATSPVRILVPLSGRVTTSDWWPGPVTARQDPSRPGISSGSRRRSRSSRIAGSAISPKNVDARPTSEKAASYSMRWIVTRAFGEPREMARVVAMGVAEHDVADIARLHAERGQLRQQLVLRTDDRARRETCRCRRRRAALDPGRRAARCRAPCRRATKPVLGLDQIGTDRHREDHRAVRAADAGRTCG